MTPSKPLASLALLFVDDEDVSRKYFERLFAKDYPVYLAENAEVAKKILRESGDKIGVMITDQRMPGELGVSLLKHTKENYPHIVRMLTTAYSELDDAIESVNSGEILRYIVKPWNIELLVTEVKYAMNLVNLQRERDLLLNEKINVWQQLNQIHQARDLLIMAAAQPRLANAQAAIQGVLTNHSFAATDPKAAGTDVWQAMVKRIDIMLSLVKASALHVDQALVDDASSAVHEAIAQSALDVADCSAKQTVHSAAITKGLDILHAKFSVASLIQEDERVEIKLTNSACLDIDEPLLTAYFLIYHGGGEILGYPQSPEVTVVFDEQSVSDEPEQDEFWLDDLLTRYI